MGVYLAPQLPQCTGRRSASHLRVGAVGKVGLWREGQAALPCPPLRPALTCALTSSPSRPFLHIAGRQASQATQERRELNVHACIPGGFSDNRGLGWMLGSADSPAQVLAARHSAHTCPVVVICCLHGRLERRGGLHDAASCCEPRSRALPVDLHGRVCKPAELSRQLERAHTAGIWQLEALHRHRRGSHIGRGTNHQHCFCIRLCATTKNWQNVAGGVHHQQRQRPSSMGSRRCGAAIGAALVMTACVLLLHPVAAQSKLRAFKQAMLQ